MKKKILALILVLGAVFGILAPSGEVSAESGTTAEGEQKALADIKAKAEAEAEVKVDEDKVKACGGGELLGFRPWYYGLLGENCEVRSPTSCKPDEENCTKAGEELAEFIWQIVINVLIDVFMLGGIVALGFLIYGGYLYLRSGGDPNFAVKGRKTITAALVGLVIVSLANVISRLIEVILKATAPNGGLDGESVGNILMWVYIMMGMVAVGGIVFGAVSWVTSQGDATKVKKGKDAILYAVIGLAVVLLAVMITNVVLGATK